MATVALLVSHLLKRTKYDEECADPVLANISTHRGVSVVPRSNPVTVSSSMNRDETGQEKELEVRTDTSQVLLFRVSLPACFL